VQLTEPRVREMTDAGSGSAAVSGRLRSVRETSLRAPGTEADAVVAGVERDGEDRVHEST
jgi:hypothetical protein